MKKNIISVFFVLSCFMSMAYACQSERWNIRQATIDDKDGMIQVMKKTHAFYNYFIVSDEMIESWISDRFR